MGTAYVVGELCGGYGERLKGMGGLSLAEANSLLQLGGILAKF